MLNKLLRNFLIRNLKIGTYYPPLGYYITNIALDNDQQAFYFLASNKHTHKLPVTLHFTTDPNINSTSNLPNVTHYTNDISLNACTNNNDPAWDGKFITYNLINRLIDYAAYHCTNTHYNQHNNSITNYIYPNINYFLPSLHELYRIYLHKSQFNHNISNPNELLLNTPYWSSTNSSNDYNWLIDFTDGIMYTYRKEISFNVRPVCKIVI